MTDTDSVGGSMPERREGWEADNKKSTILEEQVWGWHRTHIMTETERRGREGETANPVRNRHPTEAAVNSCVTVQL